MLAMVAVEATEKASQHVMVHNPLMGGKVKVLVRPRAAPTAVTCSLVSNLTSVGRGGLWETMEKLVSDQPSLSALSAELRMTLGHSKAPKTFAAYGPLIKLWQCFCERHGNQIAFPVNVALLALFLQERMNLCVEKGNRESSVTSALYAVEFAQRLAGFDLVGSTPMITLIVDAAKRMLGRPAQKKRGLSKEMLGDIALKLLKDMEKPDLCNLRVVVFLMMTFVLTARWDDIARVCPAHIFDYGDRIVVYVEHSKTDQAREGAFCAMSDSKTPLGACTLLRAILKLLPVGGDDLPIWRRVQSAKIAGDSYRLTHISYSTMSANVKSALIAVGEDPTEYGCHSGRAGGATTAARAKDSDGNPIPSRLLEKQGRWAPGSTARQGYLGESYEDLMLVAGHLEL